VDPKREYWNSYSYVGNNPVMGVDPTGKFELSTTLTDGLYSIQFETNWVLQFKGTWAYDFSKSAVLKTTGPAGWIFSSFFAADRATTGRASWNYSMVPSSSEAVSKSFSTQANFEEQVMDLYLTLGPRYQRTVGDSVNMDINDAPLLAAAIYGTLNRYARLGEITQVEADYIFSLFDPSSLVQKAEGNLDPIKTSVDILVNFGLGYLLQGAGDYATSQIDNYLIRKAVGGE
jgi:hypothetical protein